MTEISGEEELGEIRALPLSKGKLISPFGGGGRGGIFRALQGAAVHR